MDPVGGGMASGVRVPDRERVCCIPGRVRIGSAVSRIFVGVASGVSEWASVRAASGVFERNRVRSVSRDNRRGAGAVTKGSGRAMTASGVRPRRGVDVSDLYMSAPDAKFFVGY
jgi:hypothetical protein